ncbi:MAG: diguanylate cyclase [Campylobacterales bacterium]|nr:diguanylate cyclase [Campylobacterales bacterium]
MDSQIAKRKTLLFVTLTLILFSIILFVMIYINQKNRLENLEKEYQKRITTSYEKVLEKHKEFYEYRLKANINSKGVKEAFAARDREKLLDLVIDRWKVLKDENRYLEIMHFHLPNGESFLRVHKQDKYGDNIADKRSMANAMHTLQKPLFGFEAGIYMLAYRTFLPIFYESRYIGSVEFGSRPDQILHEMVYYNDIKGALFVKDDKKIIAYKEKSDLKIGDYSLQYSTLDDKNLIYRLPKDYNLDKDIKIDVGSKNYAVYVFDLKDYEGKTSAKAVFYHDITDVNSQFINTVTKLAVLLVGLLIFLMVVINYGFRVIINKLDFTNQELKKTNIFSQSILDNSPHAIVATDKSGMITLFNKKAQSLLGYKEDELLYRSTPEIFHKKEQIIQKAKEYSKELNADIKPNFELFVAKTDRGLPNDDEWIYVDKNGKEIFVSLHITSLQYANGDTNGYLGIAKDITESKIKEKQINDYVKLIDKNIITSSTDLDGNITYVSEAFCEISGYSKDELIGQNHKIVKHPDMSQDVYKELWETVINDKIWRGEIKNRKKDGGYYWVYASISPTYDFYGVKTGYTAIRQDITDKKLIEQISITDGLTNLFNRRHFNELFPKIINSAKRDNGLVSFLIMDIDHFKQYNDTYGHQGGDDVLIRVAKAIKDSLKRADDYCFRLGGEEFGVIFKTDDKQKSQEFANLIRKNIEALKIIHSGNSASEYVTASMGLVCKNANEIKDDDEVYKEADDLLYKAKESGRNRVCF